MQSCFWNCHPSKVTETFPWTLSSTSRLDGQIIYLLLVVVVSFAEVNQNLQAWCRNCQGLCNADEAIAPCGLELCGFNTSVVSDCISVRLLGGCTASAAPGDMNHSSSHLCFVLQWQWQQILQSTVKRAKCIIQLSFNAIWQLLAKQDEMVFLETSATDHSPKKIPIPAAPSHRVYSALFGVRSTVFLYWISFL